MLSVFVCAVSAAGLGLVGYVSYVFVRLLVPEIARSLVIAAIARTKTDVSFLSSTGLPIPTKRPWDVVVRDEGLWFRVVLNASLGFGDGYVDGAWTTEDLHGCLTRLIQTDGLRAHTNKRWSPTWLLTNVQSVARSVEHVRTHYDIGNDLYAAMLGKGMQYSCGWWPQGAEGLDQAQTYKMDLICRKLDLRPGMRVLDIGCGWGGLMDHVRRNYRVRCEGLTLSEAQRNLGQELFPESAFHLVDYRDYCARYEGVYDRVVSVGMFEHVGYKNYATFMACARRVLKPGGLLVLHSIGSNVYEPYGNDWIERHIFPGGALPSMSAISASYEKEGLVLEDVSSTGPYYGKTLAEWEKRATAFFATPEAAKYNERFQRMWRFYLVASRVAFELRKVQLWQLVLSKGGYRDQKGETVAYPRQS